MRTPVIAAALAAAALAIRVTIVIDTGDGHSERFSTAMVPGRDAVRGEDGRWVELPAATKAALLTAAGDLSPLRRVLQPVP
ncbi:MAG TPA: hypothetical protein VES79_07710 [Solirubrobacteraceae bacterium]|nr:hypothetical protein [Solirubrobacteraceae bacterium]